MAELNRFTTKVPCLDTSRGSRNSRVDEGEPRVAIDVFVVGVVVNSFLLINVPLAARYCKWVD